MENGKWTRRLAPPREGLSGLRRKVGEARERDQRDIRVLGGLTGSLALGALAFWSVVMRPGDGQDLVRDLAVQDSGLVASGLVLDSTTASAVPVAGMPAGVRFYWVLH